MSLLHIAGIPTAKEQRCIRCCEVIRIKDNGFPAWPGAPVSYPPFAGEDTPCKAVDLMNEREPLATELL